MICLLSRVVFAFWVSGFSSLRRIFKPHRSHLSLTAIAIVPLSLAGHDSLLSLSARRRDQPLSHHGVALSFSVSLLYRDPVCMLIFLILDFRLFVTGLGKLKGVTKPYPPIAIPAWLFDLGGASAMDVWVSSFRILFLSSFSNSECNFWEIVISEGG